MSKLLVFQHVAYEILGTLNPLLKKHGFRLRYVNFGRYPDARPSLEAYQGVVVLGGPMNVDQVEQYSHLTTEINLIREAINKGIPVLGICLGAQLIARALGGEVRRNREREIGWYGVSPTKEGKNDPLFTHFQSPETIFQWHGDTFEIPQGAVQLATSPTCINQGFRYGTNVYGLQFHLEVDEPLIERWLRLPILREEIEDLNGKTDPQKIRQDTALYIDRLKQLSDQTFFEFIRLFDIEKKRQALPSR